MRAAWWIALAITAACTAEVAPGAYFCGPEGACPEGQACNGVDNLCVVATQATPFACTEDFVDAPGDDVPAQGHTLTMQCVSAPSVVSSCLSPGDGGDWYQFDVPATCGSVQVEARVAFPVAFERLALHLSTANGASSAVETPCKFPAPTDGPEEVRCMAMAVAPGTHYAIGVLPDGTGDCGGSCAHNRYTVTIQLAMP